MAKTIREYLNELPEPEKELAFNNVILLNKDPENTLSNDECHNIRSAISSAFLWRYSLEGINFWQDIANRYPLI